MTFVTDGTDYPTCPHCDQEDQDWWDGSTMRNDGDTEVIKCFECGKLYDAVMAVTVEFSTYSVTRNEVDQRDAKKNVDNCKLFLKNYEGTDIVSGDYIESVKLQLQNAEKELEQLQIKEKQ